MIKRESYLKQIRPFIDKTELVKILIGVRRSGKSYMLAINFENMDYSSLTNAKSLHDYLK